MPVLKHVVTSAQAIGDLRAPRGAHSLRKRPKCQIFDERKSLLLRIVTMDTSTARGNRIQAEMLGRNDGHICQHGARESAGWQLIAKHANDVEAAQGRKPNPLVPQKTNAIVKAPQCNGSRGCCTNAMHDTPAQHDWANT